MVDVVACTIVAHNYLPMARLVARSFLEHHPDGRFVVVVVDRPIETKLLTDECFDVLPITEIDFGEEGFEHMATSYDVTEFATSVKPFVLRQLLDDADCVLYLDPDIYVYAPLDPLIDATMRAGWSVTPHCLEPIERDRKGPTEREIMAAGVYNLGYVGVTKAARRFVDWWAQRLRRDAINDPANQLFTDQRWIDLAVPTFGAHIERSPTYNLAYWNVDQRHLWRDDDRYMVGDEPLRFLHFSGYDPKQPWWLSKHQPERPRTLLSEHPVLHELCDAYGQAMLASQRGAGSSAPYGWADGIAGQPLTSPVRRLFHRELLEADRTGGQLPPSPFVTGGAARFSGWLRDVPPDSPRRLPRYVDVVWQHRPDLQARFPEVGVGLLDDFMVWVESSGVHESSDIALLGVPRIAPALPPGASTDTGERRRGGIDVVGYLKAELGVGEAGRLLGSALRAADLEVNTIACRGTTSRQDHPFEASGSATHDTVVMAVNADQFGNVRHEFGADFFDKRYVIGQWFWEVEAFPSAYTGAFSMLDEVWVATDHIRSALLAARPDAVVQLMPLPLLAPTFDAGLDRADLGIDERWTFLFTFDFLSVVERKNPFGVIEAFRRAFPDPGTAVLVIKTINGAQRIRDLERLRWACGRRQDIVLIDEYYDSMRAAALMNACDCYVSLHRAEGLGLTMSEAMALGKPVIATAYSGNTDFMTDDTAHLIPWKPITIGKGLAPYPEKATWADPDLDAAAQAMREVYDDPAAAAAMGARAQADLADRFSLEATGRHMRQRLEEIWSNDDA